MIILCVALFLIVIGTLSGAVVGLAAGSLFLAKTSETFKLSELQFAEAHLQASAVGYTVTRLLVDRATGSTIFKVENIARDAFLDPINLPSSLRRCDWIVEVLVDGETPDKLMENIRANHEELSWIQDGWMLDYNRFEDLMVSPARRAPNYTMKTLICSIAQYLPALPALDPNKFTEQFLLVDTTCDSDHGLFLGHVRCHSKMGGVSSFLGKSWSLRPYQYSSAFNQKAAEIIMDWLISNIQFDSSQPPPLLLDPTCGSGTFLALAMQHGWRVEGYDVNSNCAEGCLRNLKHMFGDEKVQTMADIECRDSSSSELHVNEFPSCVVSNLPWGINSVEYQHENQKILGVVRSRLKPGTPCVFVTKNAFPRLFQDTGYEIMAQARIPPSEFKLPKSKKSVDQDGAESRSDRNHCFVTMATST